MKVNFQRNRSDFAIFIPFFIIFFSLHSCGENTTPMSNQNAPYLVSSINNQLITENNDTISLPDNGNDSLTTFFLLRHAEKGKEGKDPDLLPEGTKRAKQLAKLLKGITFSNFFTTPYKRTQQTIFPIAELQRQPIAIYDPTDMSQLANTVLRKFKGKKVLISGHQNTTIDLLNHLIGNEIYPLIPPNEFDNIFIVEVKNIGDAKVIRFRY